MRVDQTTIKTESPGFLTFTQTITGLTSGTSYEFRVVLRNDGSSNSRYYNGVVSATKV